MLGFESQKGERGEKRPPQTPAWIIKMEMFLYSTPPGNVAKASQAQVGVNSNHTHVHLHSKGLQD